MKNGRFLAILIFFLLVSWEIGATPNVKVLLIGSSHGRITIGQFPVLAYHNGVDIICGNAYAGGLRIKTVADLCVSGEAFPESYGKYYDGSWHVNNPCNMTILEMLQDEEWDIICIQRAAAEDRYWNEEQAHSLETILEFIKDNCRYNPQIVFNSGFADSYSINDREKQQQETEEIWSSVQNVKNNYGIDIIPMAPIIQLLRNNNELAELGTYEKHMLSCDPQHLDFGIGMYASALVCYDFFLRGRFGKKAKDSTYLPSIDDIVSFFPERDISDAFTPIESYYAKIIQEIVCNYYDNGETLSIKPLYNSKSSTRQFFFFRGTSDYSSNEKWVVYY